MYNTKENRLIGKIVECPNAPLDIRDKLPRDFTEEEEYAYVKRHLDFYGNTSCCRHIDYVLQRLKEENYNVIATNIGSDRGVYTPLRPRKVKGVIIKKVVN